MKRKCKLNTCMRMTENEDGICDRCKKMLVDGVKKRNKKPINKKSRRKFPNLMKTAKNLHQRLRRLEEADEWGYVNLVNGGRCKWNECDGGHYFKSETCPNVRFHSMNVHPQAKMANKNMNDPFINNGYRNYLINRYGQSEFDKLEALATLPRKYHATELEEMIERYQKQLEEIKERTGWDINTKN